MEKIKLFFESRLVHMTPEEPPQPNNRPELKKGVDSKKNKPSEKEAGERIEKAKSRFEAFFDKVAKKYGLTVEHEKNNITGDVYSFKDAWYPQWKIHMSPSLKVFMWQGFKDGKVDYESPRKTDLILVMKEIDRSAYKLRIIAKHNKGVIEDHLKQLTNDVCKNKGLSTEIKKQFTDNYYKHISEMKDPERSDYKDWKRYNNAMKQVYDLALEDYEKNMKGCPSTFHHKLVK